MPDVVRQDNAAMHGWWQDLNGDFQRLNDSATDYIASLQSNQAEELMNTVAFLTYKDAIIEYLRSFIRELQQHGPAIEENLRNVVSKYQHRRSLVRELQFARNRGMLRINDGEEESAPISPRKVNMVTPVWWTSLTG